MIEMLQTQDKHNTMQNECGSQNPKSGSSKALNAQCGKLKISLEVSRGYEFWISTLWSAALIAIENRNASAK